jgi:hypothetical protein
MINDLEALNQKWLAYEFNKFALREMVNHTDQFEEPDREFIGALQPLTVAALHQADTFCWHPDPISAVTDAVRTMPGEVTISEGLFPLHDPTKVASAGWWWFTKPLPIQTTLGVEPVTAILFSHVPEHGIWFNAFIFDHDLGCTMPTVAFRWDKRLMLKDLSQSLREGYHQSNLKGQRVLGIDGTVEASVRLAQFFIAGLVWLEQRILTAEPAVGTRQVTRQAQRKYKLDKRPSITVVQLRRRQGTSPRGNGSPGRTYTCRWVVAGHWRNQPYGPKESPTSHRLIWIDSFVKGPDNQPLRETQKIFSVKH